MVSLAELVEELKTLRKGRGVLAANILRRVGPALRDACDLTENDDAGQVRRKVVTTLETLAATLPEDLRVAVTVGFALVPEARLPRYEDRVDWVARKLGCLPRTARRRIDDGVQHIAELICESAGRSDHLVPATGWHTTDLRVTVALNRARPEVDEQRRVISERHGLAELDLAVTLAANDRYPAPRPGDLEVEVVHGGIVTERRMESGERLGFTVALPRPLTEGESHIFACQYRFAHARVLRPYLACVPRDPCDRFDLCVRFGTVRLPARVQLLNGSFQRDVDDNRSPAKDLVPDSAGEVHLRFRDLRPGLAYGVRWH